MYILDIVWFLKVCTNFYLRRISLVTQGVPIKTEVITRYGHGCHLGHVTSTVSIKLSP